MNNEFLRQQNVPFEVKLKYLMQNIRFSLVGTVSKVHDEGKRIDVTLPYLDCNLKPEVLQGIEVLRPGTHDVIVKYKPKIGDVALVFGLQDYWAEGKFAHQPEKQSVQAEPFSNVTMKAILVQTNEDNDQATVIDCTDEELKITTPLKLTVKVKDAVNITCEDTTTITCKDAVNITCEDTTAITCKDDVTIDASGKDVTLTCSKATINNHLTVE